MSKHSGPNLILLSTVASITFFAAPLLSPLASEGTDASALPADMHRAAAASQNDVSIALGRLAQRLGTSPDRMRVLTVARKSTPQRGRVVSVKALNASTGEIGGISIDETGQQVGPADLTDQEAGDSSSKIHPALAQETSVRDTRRIPVMIWARDFAPSAAEPQR